MTNTIVEGGVGQVILKTDRFGRVKVSAARRNALLDEYECSGLSGMEFAAMMGIKYPTFATWVQKRRIERDKPAVPKARWLEALLPAGGQDQPQAPSIILSLPGGSKLSMATPAEAGIVAELLLALENRLRAAC